jgi:hypothetical protein
LGYFGQRHQARIFGCARGVWFREKCRSTDLTRL